MIFDEDVLDIVCDFILVNYFGCELGDVINVQVFMNNEFDMVIVKGQVKVEIIILGLIGIIYIMVNWEIEVQCVCLCLELVMVFDNIGLMSGFKILSLCDSVELLIEILYEVVEEFGDVCIGLVLFVVIVNVGMWFEWIWWFDLDGCFLIYVDWVGGILVDVEIEMCMGCCCCWCCMMIIEIINFIYWDLFDDMCYEEWEGCVEVCFILMDIDNMVLLIGSLEMFFVLYFVFDELDNDSDYWNDYFSDGVLGLMDDCLCNILKYEDNYVCDDYGLNMWCIMMLIMVLILLFLMINMVINCMGVSGIINIFQGVGWGICVILLEEFFIEGMSWDDCEVIKVMVIFIDGENVMFGCLIDLCLDYGVYGYFWDG